MRIELTRMALVLSELAEVGCARARRATGAAGLVVYWRMLRDYWLMLHVKGTVAVSPWSALVAPASSWTVTT